MFDSSPARNLVGLPSVGILRMVGYGLLVMGSLNIADVVLPFQMMDPVWEMQTAGAIVDGVPIPLLGLMLVFFGEEGVRKPWEFFIARLLSWACLLCAVLFLMLIPLIGSHAIRINERIIAQGSNQIQQQMEQLAEIEQQLDGASNDEIRSFLASQGVAFEDESADVRGELLSRLSTIKAETEAQNAEIVRNRRRAIYKNVMKWGIGSLVSSFVFLWIWRLSTWARSKAARIRNSRSKVTAANWSDMGL
ncbi:MAG: hypothetical protein F6J97_17960 [Leptolyngbya sp. SIO4C1]|nr:hypothetical protein [Leptolyngbya sp. SIO4C1]